MVFSGMLLFGMFVFAAVVFSGLVLSRRHFPLFPGYISWPFILSFLGMTLLAHVVRSGVLDGGYVVAVLQ